MGKFVEKMWELYDDFKYEGMVEEAVGVKAVIDLFNKMFGL